MPWFLSWKRLWRRWLREDINLAKPVARRDPDIRIFTHACTTWWGTHVGDTVIKGTWSQEESLLHINILRDESCQTSSPEPAPESTSPHTSVNGQHVCGSLLQLSLSLWKEIIMLFQMLQDLNISLRAVHIPSRLNVTICYGVSCYVLLWFCYLFIIWQGSFPHHCVNLIILLLC